MASKPCIQPRLLLHFPAGMARMFPISTAPLRMTVALGLCVTVFFVITACSSTPKQQETSKKPLSGTDEQIFIRGDKGIDYGTVMRVMGRVKAAGFTKVSLVTETEGT